MGDQLEAAVLGRDLLQCLPIDQPKSRAQRRVPGHDAIQRTLQRLRLQCSAQAQAAADVIRLTDALELRQKPKTLLRKRQHARCIWCQRQNRRQHGSGRRRHTRGKTLRRRMREQLSHANFGAQLLTQARGDPHRQQRMPTEGKEVIVPPNPLQTQQFTPDRGNGLFDCALRRFIRMRGISRSVRCRQCLAIQLAVRSQGQTIQLHIGCRHHVIRQHIR